MAKNAIFQFQYGAIKSAKSVQKALTGENFNSNMVRLKVGRGLGRTYQLYRFQFQYGAIKSRKTGDYESLMRQDFNSNMVRLKGANLQKRKRRSEDFNSNMVRLKV